MIDYAKLAILGVIVATVFGSGWYVGNSRYVKYKAEIEAIAKAQEASIESIKKQQQLVTKGIQDEYDAKLALLRQYYSNGVRQPSSNKLSTDALSAQPATFITPNNLLADCAQTTLMLTELQKWFLEQYQIK